MYVSSHTYYISTSFLKLDEIKKNRGHQVNFCTISVRSSMMALLYNYMLLLWWQLMMSHVYALVHWWSSWYLLLRNCKKNYYLVLMNPLNVKVVENLKTIVSLLKHIIFSCTLFMIKCRDTLKHPIWSLPLGGLLPIMANTGRLCQKGVAFSGFRYIKG